MEGASVRVLQRKNQLKEREERGERREERQGGGQGGEKEREFKELAQRLVGTSNSKIPRTSQQFRNSGFL